MLRISRIGLVRHKRNQGLGPVRNTGFSYARGKHVCFFVSDDWIDPDYALAFI